MGLHAGPMMRQRGLDIRTGITMDRRADLRREPRQNRTQDRTHQDHDSPKTERMAKSKTRRYMWGPSTGFMLRPKNDKTNYGTQNEFHNKITMIPIILLKVRKDLVP